MVMQPGQNQIVAQPGFRYTQPDPAVHVTPQSDQLTSERRILRFKPAFRFEWWGQDGQDKP